MTRVLDLFCGAGGSSAGAKAAGAQIVCGIDLWNVATETYQAHFPEASIICDRIENVNPKTLRRKIGPIDLLLASPECTHHSCARGARPRLQSSRDLAFETLKFVDEFKPRWLVIENVVNVRNWSRYDEFMYELADRQYSVSTHVIDASDSRLCCFRNEAQSMLVNCEP